MRFAIDFDGTCVEHKFPQVGEDVPGAGEVLKELVAKGHRLILYTMRSDKFLKQAVEWFKMRGIPLYGIQYDPQQALWTSTNKCDADCVIDDRNLGIPLIHPVTGRPYVDWPAVKQMLIDMGAL